ncbi:hypothetical protein SAMN05216327_1055 [Dyadobacter sp. SG02]|nr:hypothetical protein SAMN05216327_1055 [Dyadobacter sp. SG02]
MKRKTRREKLSEQIITRLKYLDNALVTSANELSDAEFETYSKEAIKLREMLSMI